MEDLFGAGIRGSDGFLRADSDNLGVAGFSLNFDREIARIDGAEALSLGRASRSIVFPEIRSGDGEFSRITIVGTGFIEIELRFKPGRGAGVEDGAPGLQSPGSFERKESTSSSRRRFPLTHTCLCAPIQFGVTGFQSFGSGDSLAARNAQPVIEPQKGIAQLFFSPQLASSAQIRTAVVLINPGAEPADLTVEALPSDPDSPSFAPVERRLTLGPGALLKADVGDFLGLEDGTVGWLRVLSDNASIIGEVSFGAPMALSWPPCPCSGGLRPRRSFRTWLTDWDSRPG